MGFHKDTYNLIHDTSCSLPEVFIMDKDLARRLYLSDDNRYADLINGLLFDGNQKILPSDLQEIDSQSSLKMRFQEKT